MVGFHAQVVTLLRDDDKEEVAITDDFDLPAVVVVDSVVVVVPVRFSPVRSGPVRSEAKIGENMYNTLNKEAERSTASGQDLTKGQSAWVIVTIVLEILAPTPFEDGE
jgi:hypothetical protein